MPYHTEGSLSDKSILITGGAGFIGSNIAEYLLRHKARRVVVLDNFLTGFRHNVEPFLSQTNYQFIEGDITNLNTCLQACEGIDIICHQAALGSVPRSVLEPYNTVKHNVDGFVNMVTAAREQGIRRFVYASSSSVYGDEPNLPKVEHRTGKPLSPYAITKLSNELFAANFSDLYKIDFIGFRYFNVFGPRQSPQGAYAAVIPLFIDACLRQQPAFINGDGKQTRDFTFVENVVQINVLAMLTQDPAALNQVYNVGCGGQYTVLELWETICEIVGNIYPPTFRANRQGDIRDSMADISKARNLLNYNPLFDFKQGLQLTVEAFKR